MNLTALPGQPETGLGIDSPSRDFRRRFKKNKTAMAGLIFIVIISVVAMMAPVISLYDPYLGEVSLVLDGPSAAHLLGTDEQGRDILSRIIFGARVSITVGLLAVGIALIAGTVLGSAAAYYGGWFSRLINWLTDIMLPFPSLLVAIIFVAVLGGGLDNAIIAIGVALVPQYVRIAREAVQLVMENDYVLAARAVGNRDSGIFLRHILPNITVPIIVGATSGVSTAILETAALGFLGLCIQPPYAEWGTMLGTGRDFIYKAPHVVYFPGVAIFLTVMAFNLLGDGLRKALSPGEAVKVGSVID